MRAFPVLLLTLSACALELPDPRNCSRRTAYYPDANEDGIGEATAVYVGCEAPAGWVTTLGPPPDTGDTGDSGDSG